MLAREHAADVTHSLQDFRAERLGPLELARLVGVVEDQRMKVAVAGVEDIGDAQPVARSSVASAAEPRQIALRGIVPSMQ